MGSPGRDSAVCVVDYSQNYAPSAAAIESEPSVTICSGKYKAATRAPQNRQKYALGVDNDEYNSKGKLFRHLLDEVRTAVFRNPCLSRSTINEKSRK